MKTEADKSSSKVRIAVLGKVNVGKSALTVRYLTKRYIGEYRSNTDLLYRQTIVFNNSSIEVEIFDVSGETRDCVSAEEQAQWSDGCVIVYSITDDDSYKYALDFLKNLQKVRTLHSIPCVLLGNKIDLEHVRQVSSKEARAAASQYNCHFFEVSVAENSSDLYRAFESIVNDLKSCNVGGGGGGSNGINRFRKFSVTKMLGTLIGKDVACPNRIQNQPPPHGGTVVVIQKSDLCKIRDK